MKLEWLDEPLLVVLAKVAGWRLGNINAQDLDNTALTFAKVDWSDEPLFVALARAAEKRLAEFNEQALADMAWAFATPAQLNGLLFVVLVRAADHDMARCPMQSPTTPWSVPAKRASSHSVPWISSRP